MKLLIGSHNPAKIKYYTAYLKDVAEIVTLNDLSITDDPEETEGTLLFRDPKELKLFTARFPALSL